VISEFLHTLPEHHSKFEVNGFHPGFTVKTMVDHIFAQDILKKPFKVPLKTFAGSVHDKIKHLSHVLNNTMAIKISDFRIYIAIHNIEMITTRNEEA
jgi:hypothetical protein